MEDVWCRSVCVYEEVVEYFSFVCTTDVYRPNLHLLNHLAEEIRRFWTYQFWIRLFMSRSTFV